MKKEILCFLLVLCGTKLLAQNASSSGFILSVNGGLSVPLGDFSKGDYYNQKSGFASAGGTVNLSATWYLSKHFGIGLAGGYSGYGFKGSQSLSDGYKEDSGTDSTTLYRQGTNHVLSILAGPYYRFLTTKKLTADAHLLGGYSNVHLAGFRIFYEDYTDNAMSQEPSSGGAFAWQAGAGLQYLLTKKISIRFAADYLATEPRIAMKYQNFIVNSGRKLSAYHQSASFVNTSLGIGYQLF
jgi:opacity protein-like surface antigen